MVSDVVYKHNSYGDRLATLVICSLVLFIGVGLLAGCASEQAKSQVPTPTPEQYPVLNVFGPTGAKSAIDLLQILIESSELPYTPRIFEGETDEPGLQGLLDGTFDITLLMRHPRADDPVVFIEFLSTPVALFVNPDSGITNLTREQVKAVFSGEVTNWAELGGADQDIVILLQVSEDTDTQAVQDYFMQGERFVDSERPLFTDRDVFLVVEGIPGAIGYASWVGKKYNEFTESSAYLTPILLDGKFPDEADYPVNGSVGVAYLPDKEAFLQPLFDWGDQIVESALFRGIIDQFGLKLSLSEPERLGSTD